MTANIWFTSDHHWGHKNFINFKDKDGNKIRPFDNVQEMDEYMMDMWNEHIKPGDKVYYVGDITFDKQNFGNIITKLNGSKRLVLGNHDDVNFLSSGGWFKKIYTIRRFDDLGFVVSHIPLHHEQFFNHRQNVQMKQIHGHTHKNSLDNPLYINVCVDVTDYKPVHMDEIIKKVNKIK